MKKLFSISIMVLCALNLFAAPVPENTARLIAANYFKHGDNTLSGDHVLNLVYKADRIGSKIDVTLGDNDSYFYVFNKSNNGFVIVSGDDATTPILAYSNTDAFETENIPPHYAEWLDSYKSQIQYIRTNNLKATAEVSKKWGNLLAGKYNQTFVQSPDAITPLLTTRWNQAPYYNELCPIDPMTNKRSVAGCVAIAMAQVIKYWNYPEIGDGYRTYTHQSIGYVSATFNEEPYLWDTMPNRVNKSNYEVSRLVYHCGVSVDMNYGSDASGAMVITATSPKVHCSEYALKTYFKYDPTLIRGLQKKHFKDDEWVGLIRNELVNGRPFIFTGFDQNAGHAWVCDGYDENNYYSMNWGWGGSYNGFYLLSNLSPGSGGIGSGTGVFNDRQEILIGIQPGLLIGEPMVTLVGDLTFNDTELNQSSIQYFSINNPGNSELSVSSIQAPDGFSCDWTGGIIPAKSSYEVKITFTPTAQKSYSGSIVVETNSTKGKKEIAVYGKGIKKIVSVLEASNDITIEILPNPATEFINISFNNPPDEIIDLSIYNSLGIELRKLDQNELNKSSISLPISEFPLGIYYCTINTASGRTTKSFVVAK